jgi:hypothetical protein
LGPFLGAEGDVVFVKHRAEVIMWYIAALENLVTNEDPEQTNMTRRVAQRTAVLVGKDDTDRLHINRLVRRGYQVRSTLAHGNIPDEDALDDLAKELRDILRRAFTRRILLDPALNIPQTCDQALLSAERRVAAIDSIIEKTRPTIDV